MGGSQDVDEMSDVYMWIAGILSGIIGAMGIGGGGILIIYLTLFADIEQMTAQGINLLFFIPCAVVALIIHIIKKRIIWRTVLPMMVGGLIGVAGGSYLAGFIGSDILGKIFAVFLVLLGAKELIGGFMKKNKQAKSK